MYLFYLFRLDKIFIFNNAVEMQSDLSTSTVQWLYYAPRNKKIPLLMQRQLILELLF